MSFVSAFKNMVVFVVSSFLPSHGGGRPATPPNKQRRPVHRDTYFFCVKKAIKLHVTWSFDFFINRLLLEAL